MRDWLTPDFKDTPYWWDVAAPAPQSAPALRPSYDVAIVGSGYTGLRAALTLVRAGRSVVAFDSADPGYGASRRNAGFLGRVLKKSFSELVRTKGLDRAIAIYRELDAAYQTTMAFIEDERIECHAARCGRFVGATSPAHYDELAAELELMRRHLGLPFEMLPKSAQHAEMATDIYHGGAVIPDLGALHPGLYHKGLMERAVAAGVEIAGGTEVTAITAGFELTTKAGRIRARDVVIATNGYTPKAFAWHARRVIPFTGYMAATERMAPELPAKVLPRRRTVIDTNLNIDFFRPAPDAPRLLFGGATGSGMVSPREIAARLHAILARALPDLAHLQLSHVWSGQCAATFDMMPHIGRHEGIWYGMGYNFAGVPMGSYFGWKLAQKILGDRSGDTVFEVAPFPTLPLYRGNPWFVPLAMRAFDWKDRWRARRRPAM